MGPDELRMAALALAGRPSLAQARALAEQARGLLPAQGTLRIGIIHTYSSEMLDPWLAHCAALEGFGLAVHHAPYGLALDQARDGSALVEFAPDLTLLLLQPGDLDPHFSRPLAGLAAVEREALAGAAIDRLMAMLQSLRRQPLGRLVVTLLPDGFGPASGLHDAMDEAGEGGWWAGFKAALTARLRGLPMTGLLDLDELLAELGRAGALDRRMWYSARFPWSAAGALELSRRVVALAVLTRRPPLKVIAVDADNTLWGGVIGEDGMAGIALGPEYPGNCFVDFQRRLLALQSRGFLLVLCSKNNPQDVAEVLRDHPHMLLRPHHFAAERVNWQPKIDNLRSMAGELSLGLDSFLMVDDSDYECAALRRELPEVEVVRVPARPVEVPFCLERVARLEVLGVTGEDRARTALYGQERERRAAREGMAGEGVDLEAYLRSLGMRMRIGIDDRGALARLAQMTRKTNQFNLTTRRHDEARLAGMIAAPDWMVAHFALADSFGDSGIVGLAQLRRAGDGLVVLDNLLMSCRVIGRRAEEAFLAALMRRLAGEGQRVIEAEFIPTAKNALAADFLAGMGFAPGEGGGWRRALLDLPAEETYPIAIEVREAAA